MKKIHYNKRKKTKRLFQCWMDVEHYEKLERDARRLSLSTSSYGRVKLVCGAPILIDNHAE